MNGLPLIYEALLARFTEMSKRVLGNNLIGVYLHGSAAMGCFNPEKSDLDLLLVVKHDIPDEVKLEFMEQVVHYHGEAPKKGLELSVVKKEYCNPLVYPTPFELHFSVTHLKWFNENPLDYVAKMKGTDKDLAAHFMITRTCGRVLFGDEIPEIFGEVPRAAYIDSIWCDIENAQEDILVDTVYITLNLCRVLAYLKSELVLSKKAGGEWGIRELPERFRGVIGSALSSYEGKGCENQYCESKGYDSKCCEDQCENTAVDFAGYMLAEIMAEYSDQRDEWK